MIKGEWSKISNRSPGVIFAFRLWMTEHLRYNSLNEWRGTEWTLALIIQMKSATKQM